MNTFYLMRYKSKKKSFKPSEVIKVFVCMYVSYSTNPRIKVFICVHQVDILPIPKIRRCIFTLISEYSHSQIQIFIFFYCTTINLSTNLGGEITRPIPTNASQQRVQTQQRIPRDIGENRASQTGHQQQEARQYTQSRPLPSGQTTIDENNQRIPKRLFTDYMVCAANNFFRVRQKSETHKIDRIRKSGRNS